MLFCAPLVLRGRSVVGSYSVVALVVAVVVTVVAAGGRSSGSGGADKDKQSK